MSVIAAKQAQLTAKLDEADALQKGFTDDPASHTPEAQETFEGIVEAVKSLQSEIKTAKELADARAVAVEEVPERKVREAAKVTERFQYAPTLGEQIINADAFKSFAGQPVPSGMHASTELKGFLRDLETKDTFTNTLTGLDTTVNYLNRPIQLLQQQRLTVRDLLPVGQTTQTTVKFIKESSFTNAADMVAEEGEKPEASFATTSASADVKKIAVVAKVTDEMWADFPMLRDYVNTRLRFMVEAKEEQQLLSGTGSGNQITGLLQTSGIQTQSATTVSSTNPVVDSIHKAMTKIRVATGTVGGYDPNGIIMHPTDYQIIRLSKDGAYQYYGGGPFYGAYGNGGSVAEQPGPWGLRCVVTTAITAGTALVGDFRQAQIWQREGIRVDATNTNEDDFTFNRISLRVEERLALAVYAPSAFCTVTSIV